RGTPAKRLGRHAADQFDVVEPQPLLLGLSGAGNHRAGDQLEAVDDRGGDKNVPPAGREGARGVAEEAATPVQDFEDSGYGHLLSFDEINRHPGEDVSYDPCTRGIPRRTLRSRRLPPRPSAS